MMTRLSHNKETNVAFVDALEAPADATIFVIDVSEQVGLRCSVQARINADTGEFLGLIIENYPAFHRALMRKHRALQVEKGIDLIATAVKASLSKNELRPQRELAAY